ncbi:hypothetical protein DUNSADRAFT_7414 [Dunaliella salina]|uniref:Secreted protein n=1 Tax=Dunaliella salina TaxID=3046 RepID=A0ABQ7H6F3_DUNSA|nr:hypothetical protein DUNSADRAFT_7414 [Dunaliella salina]|eukprot:KAF5842430.1 hypothetical protein DUNSADRAFT_7414 [Dunaliella salina]
MKLGSALCIFPYFSHPTPCCMTPPTFAAAAANPCFHHRPDHSWELLPMTPPSCYHAYASPWCSFVRMELPQQLPVCSPLSQSELCLERTLHPRRH